MLNKKKNNKGFTLVELLVVIAIIGILAVIAVPALMSNLEKGKVAKLEADYNVIATAAVTYYADKNVYPDEVLVDKVKTVEGNMSGYVSEVSNPFKAKYTLNYEAATTGTDAKPEIAEIIIEGAKIKNAGIEKLKNDLGADKVKESAGTINIALVGSYK